MSVKKSQDQKNEVTPEGTLLREMLDASVDSKAEDVFENAEALFKKSKEEEQERIVDFSEWIEDIARQAHPEIDFEDEPAESVTQMPSEIEQNDTLTEPAVELDQLLSEVNADTAEAHDQKEEKAENAERSL